MSSDGFFEGREVEIVVDEQIIGTGNFFPDKNRLVTTAQVPNYKPIVIIDAQTGKQLGTLQRNHQALAFLMPDSTTSIIMMPLENNIYQ